jgi:hypothetical protein
MWAGIRRLSGGDVSLIDLDEPADRATGGEQRPLSRSRVTVVAVVALLIGAALGGIIVHRWTVEQARAIEGRKVSVFLFTDQGAGSGAVDSIVNDDGTVQGKFVAAIAVVNAGPRPIEIQSLTAQKTGLTIAGSARSTWISPGTSLAVYVDITATCLTHKVNGGIETTINGGIMQASVSVRTSSGAVVTVSPLSFDTSPWADRFQTAIDKCLPPPT